MRLVDVQLAIPFFLLAVTLAALLGQGLRNVILLLGATSWIGFARIVRAQVLSLKQLPFIESARSVGVRPTVIMVRHVLPNSWTPIIVLASQAVGALIVAESSLTFLGVGVPPDTATVGWHDRLRTQLSRNCLVDFDDAGSRADHHRRRDLLPGRWSPRRARSQNQTALRTVTRSRCKVHICEFLSSCPDYAKMSGTTQTDLM